MFDDNASMLHLMQAITLERDASGQTYLFTRQDEFDLFWHTLIQTVRHTEPGGNCSDDVYTALTQHNWSFDTGTRFGALLHDFSASNWDECRAGLAAEAHRDDLATVLTYTCAQARSAWEPQQTVPPSDEVPPEAAADLLDPELEFLAAYRMTSS